MKIWSEYTLCNSPYANRCGTYSKIYSTILAVDDSKGRIQLCSIAVECNYYIYCLTYQFFFLLIHHQCICFVSTINNNGTNRSRTQFYIRICVFLYVLFIRISGIQYRFYIYLFSFYMLLFRIFREKYCLNENIIMVD